MVPGHESVFRFAALNPGQVTPRRQAGRIHGISGGDHFGAWEAIVRQHWRKVFNVAYKFVGKHDEAEEILDFRTRLVGALDDRGRGLDQPPHQRLFANDPSVILDVGGAHDELAGIVDDLECPGWGEIETALKADFENQPLEVARVRRDA